jgi:hypothetical protein
MIYIYIVKKAAMTIAIYRRYLLVKIIPKFPIFLAITLSSKEFKPKVFDYFTSFKHFAHLWTAYFVKPIKNGINIRLITPKINIPNTANKYPNRFVSYVTIECETLSQCGHFTFCGFSSNKIYYCS